MSINFQDLKMQLCDLRMEMCQMKMQNGETSQNIADLNKNGVRFGTLVVVLVLLADALAYLFASSLLVLRLV
jgi:hypothetical protein